MSVELLRERIGAIPAALERTGARALPELDVAAWSRAVVVVTGVGLAAGPARAAVHLLSTVGVAARFEPVGAFAVGAPLADALIVFSQGMSPNARIAMSRGSSYERALLVTSEHALEADGACGRALARWRAEGARVWALAPRQREDGMLLRVLGPASATYGAMRLAAMFAGGHADWELERVPGRVADAIASASELDATLPLDGSLVLVSCGMSGALTRALAWKSMEAIWSREPLVTDVFDFAHGPLQATAGERVTLLVLRGGAEHDAWVERLAEVAPALHELVESRAQARGPAALLEHDVTLDVLLCRALEETGRELDRWPARGEDAALYCVCDETISE